VSLLTLRGDRVTEALNMTSSAPQTWRTNPAAAIVHPVYMQPGTWDTEHLGTYARLAYDIGGSAELANREVSLALDTRAGGAPMRAFYSLYVRNNPEDESGTITQDADSIVRLVSVGWVANVDGRVLAVKIIEEEFDLRAEFVARGTQEGQNQGGTNQAVL